MQAPQAAVICCCREEDRAALNQALSIIENSFEGRKGELIPLLQSVQREIGYLPEEALLEIARKTRVPAATVFGVATFYRQFRLQPEGRHTIRVCTGTTCHVKGSNRILSDLKHRLHIEPDGTTDDRSFTLRTAACFGACALAPVVVVDESVYGGTSPKKTREIVDILGNGDSNATSDGKERH